MLVSALQHESALRIHTSPHSWGSLPPLPQNLHFILKDNWRTWLRSPHFVVGVQPLSLIQLFVTPWSAGQQAPLSSNTFSQILPKVMAIESVLMSPLILGQLLLLLQLIFPSTRVFSSDSALCIKWSKYWSFSFNISPSSVYSSLISFRIDQFEFLAVKGLSKVFSSITIWKHQIFGTQSSLWSNSHICTWLLEKQ